MKNNLFTKNKAKNKVIDYLKRYNIMYSEDFDNATSRVSILYKGCGNCPDEILESCIWFHEDCME